jgi:type 1 glutamine amidotransferase
MSGKKALIVWGGWDGHEPEKVAQLFESWLSEAGFAVEVSGEMDAFLRSAEFDLVVPVVTMSGISGDQLKAVTEAVRGGVGLAGCHGGMCDSFRDATEWQFMTGGQWVAHPGNDGVRYTVMVEPGHPITDGLPDFEVVSEQYYLHTDPGNHVLAWTAFPHPEHPGDHSANPCRMPQAWTRRYGAGRVFYSALGHQAAVFDQPTAAEMMLRGLAWAAR